MCHTMVKALTKRLIISGWYGKKNLGDEAQLSAIVTMARDLMPDIEVTVLSDDPERTIREYGTSSIQGRRCLSLKLLKKMARADLFILGGGTLLYDSDGGAGALIHRLHCVVLAKLMGIPVMYFNAGVGVIYSKISRYYVKHVCNVMDLIVVRDCLSKDNLISLGVRKPVYVGADSVFALAGRLVGRTDGPEARNVGGSPKVGINVRSFLYALEDVPAKYHDRCRQFGGWFQDLVQFRKAVASVVDHLKQEKGASVTLFPISYLEGGDDCDVYILEEVAHLSRDWHDIEVVRNECTYVEMLRRIAGFDLVIGMRLHALEFAAMLGVPVLAISYDSKISSFMASIGQEEYALNVSEVTGDLLCKKVDQLWICREQVAEELGNRLPKLISNAEQTARLMCGLLAEDTSKRKLVLEGVSVAIMLTPCILLRALHMLSRIAHCVSPLPFWLKMTFLSENIRLRTSIVKEGRDGESVQNHTFR